MIRSSQRARQPTRTQHHADTSRHSKHNRKSGYELPPEARTTPAT
jgi:hypothetical protein